ncbi:uncharacterized protein [Hyperolius riggenbachi]|uniref:uncharacterized protein n=1 Tax=Hyperolius riggenbachi TaxID=752182 RepID=UPI0035A3783C
MASDMLVIDDTASESMKSSNPQEQELFQEDLPLSCSRRKSIDRFMEKFWSQLPNQRDDPSFYEKPTAVSRRQQATSEVAFLQTDTEEENTTRPFDWCECGKCTPMKTQVEELCCNHIEEVRDKIPRGKNCITEVEFFINSCTSSEYVETNLKFHPNVAEPPLDQLYNRKLRKTAYRTFTAWVYGFLGKERRRTIPSCAVNVIRQAFPDAQHLYASFLFPEDYNASEMIHL